MMMKIPFSLLLALLVLASCKKENPLSQTAAQPYPSNDSASYIIDGKRYVCDEHAGRIWENLGVHMNMATGAHDPDSVLYGYALELKKNWDSDPTDDGRLLVHFLRKMGKNEFTQVTGGGFYFMNAEQQNQLLARGRRPFAIDFRRGNNQDGVVLEINGLISFINAPQQSPTTLGPDCQNGSRFEVVNVVPLSDGSRVIEAKFNCNLFDAGEQVHSLTDGFLRLHVY